MSAVQWTWASPLKLPGVITRSVRRGRKHSQYHSLRTAVSLPGSFRPVCATACESELGPIDVSDKAESCGEVRGNSFLSPKMEPTVRIEMEMRNRFSVRTVSPKDKRFRSD